MSLKTTKYKEKHKLTAINKGEYGYFEVVKKPKINKIKKYDRKFGENAEKGRGNANKHNPVMLDNVLQQMDKYMQDYATQNIAKKPVIIDVTFGNGGYSQAILEKYPNASLIAFDRDESVAERANEMSKTFGDRFLFINDKFSNINKHIDKNFANIIVADFGVSSMQLDTRERGFSFQHDAPLDMRMDLKNKTTAASLLQNIEENDLCDIIYNFGGERMAKKIASHICTNREQLPITTTKQLADIVLNCYGAFANKLKIHPATKTFQALRICVNNELEEITKLLSQSLQVLCNGGIFIAVSFHELEDGEVKRFIKSAQSKAKSNKYSHFSKNNQDINHEEAQNNDNLLTDICGVVNVSRDEALQNPRSRSAKMRCFAKNN